MRNPSRTPLAMLLAALALGACASPEPASSGRVVPVGELPERHRQVLVDYGAGGAAWEARRDEVRADPELARFLVDNLVVEMVRAMSTSTLQRDLTAEGPYERAQAELVRFADVATPVLVALLEAPDDLVVFCAGQTLGRIGRPACLPVAALLAREAWKTRLRACEVLGELPHAGRDEEAVRAALERALRADPEWVVRARAALALGSRGARDRDAGPWLAALSAGLRDPDPSVVRSAAEGLRTLGDPRAVPPLADALERSIAAGRTGPTRAAQEALCALTGERRNSPAAWRAWWRDVGSRRFRPTGP